MWINQGHPEPAPFFRRLWWGQLETNQAVLRDTHGTAVSATGSDLAGGFWSHWRQSCLGIFLIKPMLESLGQMKLLRAMWDTCQSSSWE